MSCLFRIEKNGRTDDALLGWDWIEVLAIEPWALGHPTAEYGDWCDRTINVMYICLTEDGLVRIGSDDFWSAVEDYREYVSETARGGVPPMTISTGERSVVQVGSTSIGDISTGDRVELVSPDDLARLARELADLRRAIKDQHTADDDPGIDVVVGALAEAQDAANRGDQASLARSLKRVGSTVIQTARDIGVELAAAAISRALHLKP